MRLMSSFFGRIRSFAGDFSGSAKFPPVLFSLVGIEGAEFGQRFSKAAAIAEIAGDGQRVAGACVAPRQQLAADFGVGQKAGTGLRRRPEGRYRPGQSSRWSPCGR